MPSELATVPSKIPSPPPLIKILGYLGAGHNGYWDVPCSGQRRMALDVISMAAVEADRNKTPFTKKYMYEHMERIGFGENFRITVRAWLDEITGEVDGFGEVLVAIAWVCREINDLTGISVGEIMQTIERKGKEEPELMDVGYGRESLNHVAAKLRELDADGNGQRIWRFIWRKCHLIRRAGTCTRASAGASERRPLEGEHNNEFPANVEPQPALTAQPAAPTPVQTKIDPLDETKKPLPPSRAKAYALFEWALQQNAELASKTDREVYEWLKTKPDQAGDLPANPDTFSTYLKEARRYYRTPKHLPRSGRAKGKSVVDQDQL
jgi:hypothetical protein